MSKVKVSQAEDQKEVPVEVIAQSIEAISVGIKKLRAGPLNDKALILLIQHATPLLSYGKRVGTTEIKAVLTGIESLEKTYLKSKKAVKP